ncbi:MAG: NADH-quinone oxidoreductase subunit L [Thiobacillaceae bacterium]|nr:NADH-quinone oxidoreductase subunit L [Thiobacillaceae bacterium]MCX7672468.1 NADH-quinone oxidoreductase subunit L [Thiobacillaceae bacterium]MDW8323100.1 NADH-quinone oxidoreductase subunit L [Burkholderiales bacterium]
MTMKTLYLLVPLAPLLGALLAGLAGRAIGRTGAHTVTILGVAVSFLASLIIFFDVLAGNTFNGPIYTWATAGDLRLEIGFLIDPLSALMMLVVSFVSLCVHVYTIGYMADDPGYQRFFSYIALFTFSMLMLVMSNNFLQLFFGWEAVGLVSYLLIGFWYTRESAIYANLKAFLVNRVGDLGFLLGIGLIWAHFGTLDYAEVFQQAPQFRDSTVSLIEGQPWGLITVICILLFIGAMGKSAQMPLHVWLPDSMEGPTPISALIHAATMVTAGIFMVARMSPLYELSDTALSVVLVVGAVTALAMGLLGIVQNDIKRVIAYSTLSQLGYMTVALGVSAYSVAIFHLMTHAFFKALLFLAAGSVIIGLHHDQDMRNMGGLRRYMPITWITLLIGALALIGTPGLSGFFSKDAIILATYASDLPGAGFAAFAVTAGVFVTALYTFRMYFMVFHGPERFRYAHVHHAEQEGGKDEDHHGRHGGGHSAPHESPWVVTAPLVVLAIPSIYAGWAYIEPLLFGGFFGSAIHVDHAAHPAMRMLAEQFHGPGAMVLHGFVSLPFWLALAGVGTAAYLYLVRRDLPEKIRRLAGVLYTVLERKYGFDDFNDWFFAGGARRLGGKLWRWGDVLVIDGGLVNGSARLVGHIAAVARRLQTGYLYHYAFAMIVGVALMVTWFVD